MDIGSRCKVQRCINVLWAGETGARLKRRQSQGDVAQGKEVGDVEMM